MKQLQTENGRRHVVLAFLLFVVFLQVASLAASAQNMGERPQFNKTLQGETAGQVEGTLKNVVNFIGNVICPIGAGLCVAMAVVSYANGRGVVRWAVSAAGLLMVGALTHLLENFVIKAASIH